MLSWAISRLNPRSAAGGAVGVLGDLSGPTGRGFAENLRRDGYVVFQRAMPAEVCDRLRAFADCTPTKVRRMDGEAAAGSSTVLFKGERPAAVRYDYDTDDLLDNPDVQDLLADRSLLKLAEEYLGCQPVADVLSMWWHTNFHAQPDSEAAQFYHFDMDRIKWLKVFVYLTDVGPANGPHSFVACSHRNGGIPWHMRRKGYVRLDDDEVIGHYGAERCKHVTAPRGSIIVEDTRGLHKGNTVSADPRLVLQLQFSNSLFGGYYPPSRITSIQSPTLRQQLQERPKIYRQYT